LVSVHFGDWQELAVEARKKLQAEQDRLAALRAEKKKDDMEKGGGALLSSADVEMSESKSN